MKTRSPIPPRRNMQPWAAATVLSSLVAWAQTGRLLGMVILSYAPLAWSKEASSQMYRPIPGQYLVVYRSALLSHAERKHSSSFMQKSQSDLAQAVRSVAQVDHQRLNQLGLRGQVLDQARSTILSRMATSAAQIRLLRTYNNGIHGFVAKMSEAEAKALAARGDVAFVEQDALLTTQATQQDATWGLDRLDQRDLPLNFNFSYSAEGKGVTAYVVDTGLRADHTEFTNRVVSGFDAVGDGFGTGDCNGHGTHVAGTLGGTVFGVAKQVRISPIRVFGCKGSGAISQVVAGLDWIAQNGRKPAVVNLSLGGSASATLDSAVQNLLNNNYHVVSAAGNNAANACNYSPSRVNGALTVGSIDRTDSKAFTSNFGSCVDIFAPGVGIVSAGIASSTANTTLSGTSMASPHIAGLVAQFLEFNPDATVQAAQAFILAQATPNKVLSAGSESPNLLAFAADPSPPPPPPPPPVALSHFVSDMAWGSDPVNLSRWKARVRIQAWLSTGQKASNAHVTVRFSNNVLASCTTDANGLCAVSTHVNARTTSLSAQVSNITAENSNYQPSLNKVSAATIKRPPLYNWIRWFF